jgi:chromosomal replication initiator protein
MDASIWDQILARVETKVNRHSFYTWFKPTSFVADAGSSITVSVPNSLFKDWLTKHYSVVLAEALNEVRRPGASLVFVAEGATPPHVREDERAASIDLAPPKIRGLPRLSRTRRLAA